MDQSLFQLDEALKAEPASPPLDAGIVLEDMEPFDLNEALAGQIEAPVVGENPEEDEDLVVNVEQGDREPPQPRTVRIGESDVIFYEAEGPMDHISEDSSDAEDTVDPSCFDFEGNESSDFEDEQFLQPVSVNIPSMFSSSFGGDRKTEVSSEAEMPPSSATVGSDELRLHSSSQHGISENGDVELMLRTTISPATPSSNGFEGSELTEPNTNVKQTIKPSSEATILQASNVSFTYSQPDGNDTFLPVCPTPVEILTPVQVVASTAGCSSDTVQAVKNLSVSQLHDVTSDLKSPDAEKITDQLSKNALAEWNPSSIVDGIGKDLNGNHTNLSLVQLANAVSNFNEHLLLMQKELVKFENDIKQIHSEDQIEKMGFKDPANINHLMTLLNSLTVANRNMDNGVSSIKATVKAVSIPNEKGFSKAAAIATGVGAALGSILLFKK